jgi:hypothetical protein
VASLERATTDDSVIDVLDRVLDKGIVVDAWMRLAVVGIDLTTVQARVVVASIGTYLTYANAVAEPGTVSPAPLTVPASRPRTIEQLRRIGEELETASVLPGEERGRAEGCVLEELHDARARTVNPQWTRSRC